MDSNVGSSPLQPRKCPSRGCLHPPAGFQMVARRAGGNSLHRRGSHRRRFTPRRPLDRRRYFAGLRARKFARSMARGNGQVCSRGVGSRFSNALHHPRPRRDRPNQYRPRVRQGITPAARPDAATHQRPLRHPARRRRFSRGSTRLAAQRRDAAQLSAAHASARKTLRVQPPALRRKTRNAVARKLGFLLAAKLSARGTTAVEGRNGAASDRLVRQFAQ